jgi:hypothetical protein
MVPAFPIPDKACIANICKFEFFVPGFERTELRGAGPDGMSQITAGGSYKPG